MSKNPWQTGEPRSLKIRVDSATLEGDLNVPPGAEGIVLFAHGSGSSRHSRRNRFVARTLSQGGLGALLVDLLTEAEEEIDVRTRRLRFDIDLLARRLVGITDWTETYRETKGLDIGLFGSSTGAAAALMTAQERPALIRAVVSRGGRPDLATAYLPEVKAPTLLIVGGNDFQVLQLSRQALTQLRIEKKLEIVPGATHLFEEPGCLEKVAILARDWFLRHLGSASTARRVSGGVR